jgi:transcriptional regulator with XRE-family HTH domain
MERQIWGSEVVMTAMDLKRWLKTMNFTVAEGREAIGISRNTMERYLSGKADPLPLTVALACSAIYHRVLPWG